MNGYVYGTCFYVYRKECVCVCVCEYGKCKFMGRIIFMGRVPVFMRRCACLGKM